MPFAPRYLVCDGKAGEASADNYKVERFATGYRGFISNDSRTSRVCCQQMAGADSELRDAHREESEMLKLEFG